MSSLTGTGVLVRLIVRRDRVRMLVWIAGISALVLAVASSIQGLYPTAKEVTEAAATLQGNTAQIALNGPDHGLDTLGGRVAFEVWNFGLVGVALMSLFTVSRHTRADEEAGRTELLRAAPIGAHAPSAAAVLVVAGMNVLVGTTVAVGLALQGLPATGSAALGAAFTATGIVFTAICLVAVQVTDNTRVANGITGAVLAMTFVTRAMGDVGDGTISWTSPLGWSQAMRPYAGERWWPLAIALAATVVLVAVATTLNHRRDVGAGIFATRPGPALGPPTLASPSGLALRLQRGSLIAWTTGLFLGGLALGTMGKDVDDFVGDNQALRDALARSGEDPTDSFFATFFLLLALIGTGYALQAAQRPHTEETTLRAEPILATPVPRLRWATAHLATALIGTPIVLAAGGLGAGLTYSLATDDFAQTPRLIGAAVAHTPAVWVLVGLAAALFGLAPRALPLAWASLAACLVVGLLGQLLDLPEWITAISPFDHIPRLPAGELTVLPLLAITATAVLLTAVGLTGLARRDLDLR